MHSTAPRADLRRQQQDEPPLPAAAPEGTLDAAVVIVAAGSGSRVGGAVPKQFRMVAGQPLLARTLSAVQAWPRVGQVMVAIRPEQEALFRDCLPPGQGPIRWSWCPGGETRQDSVRHGLEALAADQAPEAPVLIHDAARPLASPDLAGRVLEAIRPGAAVLPWVPVADTVRGQDSEGLLTLLPRERLKAAQTPQGFVLAEIAAAHRAAIGLALTDDVAVGSAHGLEILAVPGDPANGKVTTAEDLAALDRRLSGLMEPRTGFGFDVHAFAPADPAEPMPGVMLGGLRIPHPRRLAGHSDADVGIHALCDAIYGALAEGDIGQHFPPSDQRWRGAESRLFLEHAVGRIAARNGRLLHLDLTFVCERPKIGPMRDQIRERLAQLCGLDPSRVSVKATTSEKLGFTGREEGIAAQAVVTLLLPADG